MRRLCVALAALLFVSAAHARTELNVELQRGAEAKITVGSCFDQLPPAGYAPVDIKIENHASEPRAWTFDFDAPSFGTATSLLSKAQLVVPEKSSRTFRLAVPLTLVADPYGNPLNVRVSGPGTTPASMASFPPVNRAGRQLSPFVAMSESLAARFRTPLEEEFKPTKLQLADSRFRPGELPEDWRTLVGFAAIWITADELAQLSAAQRGAVHDWVHRGGRLFVFGDGATTPALPEVGFGTAVAVRDDTNAEALAESIRKLAPTLETRLSEDYWRGNWGARDRVGELAFNVPLLVGFVVLFAAVSGPVNLFWFAPAGRRHRLFWTTPAISLAASVLLALVILLQDGFGGTGYRVALVHVIAPERKQVVLQEQIARTGVLRSAAFTTADPTFVAPITLSARAHGGTEVFNVDRQFEGPFRSRALQGHWLETVTSTRAEVSLLNVDELRANGTPPVILSSIDAPLEQLYYCDEARRMWQAANVRPGEKITLEPSTVELLFPTEAGPRLRTLWESIWPKPGHFYATARQSGALIETLPSIRWNNQRVVYFGAITTAAPTP